MSTKDKCGTLADLDTSEHAARLAYLQGELAGMKVSDKHWRGQTFLAFLIGLGLGLSLGSLVAS